MSTASREAARRKAETRWRPRPVTIAILVLVTLLVFGTMIVAWPPLGLWPFQSSEGITVKPSSPHAEGLAVEVVGTPIVLTEHYTHTVEKQATVTVITETYNTVTVTVRITNHVMQAPPLHGTPTPGAPTPQPEPARIINASVKVLFYDRPRTDPNKKIVGSGVGNYYNAQGLGPNESAELVVVATDVGEFNRESGWEAFADGLWTDKDPLKTLEPLSVRDRPAQSLGPVLSHTP